MSIGGYTCMGAGPRNHVLNGVQIPNGKAYFLGIVLQCNLSTSLRCRAVESAAYVWIENKSHSLYTGPQCLYDIRTIHWQIHYSFLMWVELTITHTRPIRSCDVNGADGLHYRTVVYINSKRSNELSVVQLGKYMLCGSIHCCYQSRRLWLSTEPRSCTDHTWNVLLV